jgi:peroxiredoxin
MRALRLFVTAAVALGGCGRSDPSLVGVDGHRYRPLAVMSGARGNVLFFVANECPIANRQAPEIARVAAAAARDGFAVFVVNVDADRSDIEVADHARDHALPAPVLVDRRHELVRMLGVTATPEVAVVLPGGTIAYRGRIDDRFADLDARRPAPRSTYLRDALDSIRSGRPIATPRTEPLGCAVPPLPDR